MTSTDFPGIELPARTVPVPRTISPQAQAFLAQMGAIPPEATPAPEDKEGWKAHIEKAGANLSGLLQEMGKNYPAQISSHELSASTLYELQPPTYSAANSDSCVYYLHGGGYTVGSGVAAAYAALNAAGTTGLRAFSLDYRMPPDHPFPAAVDDAVEGYQFLLERYAPEKIAVGGGSAGAGLAAACVLKARDAGLPLPAACLLLTPEADLTESGDTFETNALVDVIVKQRLTNSILLYANGHDLKDPYLSPLFGDFTKGFPPTLLTSGTRDMFLSNTVRFHRALRRAGVEAELHVWEAMPHGGFFGAPEDWESYDEQYLFIKRHLGLIGRPPAMP